MKRLAVCSLALVAAATATSVALATTEVSRYSTKFGTAKQEKSTSLRVVLGFRDPAKTTGAPESLRSFVLALHRGSVLDTRGAPRCTATAQEIQAKGGDACPAATQIGKGTAVAINDAGTQAKANVEIDNMRGKWLFTVKVGTFVADKFTATIKGRAITAEGLNPLPGGNHTQSVDFTIDRSSRAGYDMVTTPDNCPRSRRWTSRGRFRFADGTTDRVRHRSRCRRSAS